MTDWEDTKRAGQTAFIRQENGPGNLPENISHVYRQIAETGHIEEDLTHFIARVDAFFDEMEKSGKLTVPRPLSEETYKEMWMLRYQQQLGNLSFLELMDKYEEILGIPPHTSPH